MRTYDGPTGPIRGTSFAVWAPHAKGLRVKGDFNSWDGREHPMRQLGVSGVWELFVPDVTSGTRYKFVVLGADDHWREKADPMAFHTEVPPSQSSVVFDSTYTWGDDAWMEARKAGGAHERPMSTYEMHLGSWRRGRSYVELADDLVAYLVETGFTHVEFLPVMEHPFGGSWGYQVTSYFAPTARFGDPDGLRYLVDRLHQAGIGVIVDWVPAHFPKDDFALARFDGTPLYEDPNPSRGEHPDWGTYVFNFGRKEVRNFLVSNALYWLEEFHIDGLRVDAVASMLYLDYSREDGEWTPNVHGGRENLEAVAFLQEMNATAYKRVPGAITIAEESTSWPGVTRADPPAAGSASASSGTWAGCTTASATSQNDPIHRQYHHGQMTFSPGLRLLRELRAADQPRRGRARQGLAAAQDAGRPVAAAGEPAHLPGLHVGAPRQAAAVHGLRVRPGVASGPRAASWTGGCSTTPDHRGVHSLVRDLNGDLQGHPGALVARQRPGRLRVDRRRTTPATTCSRFIRCRRTPARGRWSASRTSPPYRTTATGSGCRRPARGRRC